MYGLFSKGALKIGYSFQIDKHDIFLAILGNIFIFLNFKQNIKAGITFISKYKYLISIIIYYFFKIY